MAGDWLARLTPSERREWDEIVRHSREELLPRLEESAFVLSLAPSGKPDAKYCIELGFSIMLDKPILVVAPEGYPVPERLRRAADEVIELPHGAGMDTEAGQQLISDAITRMHGRLKEGP